MVEVRDIKHSKLIWDRLRGRFMSASNARYLELKRMLSTLKKPETQPMDQYLREVKASADSLAAINCPVSPRDLINHTINGLALDPDYDTLGTFLTHYPGDLTFDDLRTKLLTQERRIKRSKQLEVGSVAHQALATTSTYQGGVSSVMHTNSTRSQSNNQGGRHHRGGRGNWRGGKYRGRGGGRNQNNARGGVGHQYTSSPPAARRGNFPSDGALLSHPNTVVCQICHPGHGGDVCPIRYNQNPSPPNSAFVTNLTGEANETLWYPNSAASSHMTPLEGSQYGEGSTSRYQ